MEIITLEQKLNSILQLPPIKKGGYGDKLSFSCGNFALKTASALKDKVVYGKIALFAMSDTFLKIGLPVKKELLRYKISTIDCTLSKAEVFNIETVSKTFVLADDIRAVVVLDGCLSKFGDYFSYCKNLPVVDVSNGLDIGEYLESSFFLRNGNNYDEISLFPKKTVVVDTSLSEILGVPKSYGYDYVFNNVVSLFDIRIEAYYSGKAVDGGLYNMKSKAISATFSVMKEQEKNRIPFLTVNCALIGMANRGLALEYLENDSLLNLSTLYFGDKLADKSLQLVFSKKIMNLYGILFSSDGDLHLINDYNRVAEICEEILGISQDYSLDNIFIWQDKLATGGKSFIGLREKLKGEVQTLSKAFDNVIKTHVVLGGNEEKGKTDYKKLSDCIKGVGALTKNVSGQVLLIKEGLTSLM